MRLLAVAVAATLLVVACGSDDNGDSPSSDTDTFVTGDVIAPPEAPPVSELPANAILTVTLQDVSVADAPAMVLATQTIELAGEQFPIPYELAYSLGDIVATHTYSVASRVEAGGDQLMISDTMTPVITRDAPTSGVDMSLVYIASN